MNFRVVIAKTARRLGLAWLYTALGWFVLAALTGSDWPFAAFLDQFTDEEFHALFVMVAIGPSAVLRSASERLGLDWCE